MTLPSSTDSQQSPPAPDVSVVDVRRHKRELRVAYECVNRAQVDVYLRNLQFGRYKRLRPRVRGLGDETAWACYGGGACARLLVGEVREAGLSALHEHSMSYHLTRVRPGETYRATLRFPLPLDECTRDGKPAKWWRGGRPAPIKQLELIVDYLAANELDDVPRVDGHYPRAFLGRGSFHCAVCRSPVTIPGVTMRVRREFPRFDERGEVAGAVPARLSSNSYEQVDLPLLTAGARRVTEFRGILRARPTRTWAGCSIAAGEERHYPELLLLQWEDRLAPLLLSKTPACRRWTVHGNKPAPATISDLDDLRLPLDRPVRVKGRTVKAFVSGTIAPEQVYGIRVQAIEPAGEQLNREHTH